MALVTYLKSLQSALHALFAEDERVYLLGEDLLDPYGGAFKVSAGLSTLFPERVLTTPISEAALIGVASGMALRGLRPIVEIMFGDFLTLCADQLINHAAKFRAMYAGQVEVPLVVRTPVGGGRGYGPTHSQSLEKLFLGIPYLRIVAPSHFHDPGQLLRSAVLEDRGVVLFIENKLLYPQRLGGAGGRVNVRPLAGTDGDVVIAENFETGTPDVTLIAYGGISRLAEPVLERLVDEEIRVQAIFPATIQPLPADVLASAAARTGRVVVCEEGSSGFNWGSEVAALLNERLWRRLEVPVHRLAARPTIVPAARPLEDEALVTAAKLEEALLEVLE